MDDKKLIIGGKKSRGRPAKLAPAHDAASKLYDRVKPLLPDDLREYMEGSLNGELEFDGLHEMELLLKTLSVYTNSVISWAQEDERVSRDVAAVIAEFRMAIRDHEEMRRRRVEMEHKYGDNERVVDPTRKPALARFEDIHR